MMNRDTNPVQMPHDTPRNGETIRLHVLRYNPQNPGDVPHMQTYEIEQSHGMTLFMALNEVRERLDPSLQFDFVCRAGICGSCGMMINGRPCSSSSATFRSTPASGCAG